MQILKVKTAEDFNNSQVPEGYLLIWPEVVDGEVYLHCKNSNGDTAQISGKEVDLSNYYNKDEIASLLKYIDDKISSTATLHVGISGKHGAYLVGGSAVVDNGNGTVTFEVYHCFLDDGDSIRIAHTVNYDGTYNIVSHMDGDYHPDTNPTGNKGTVTITASYVAETLPSGDTEAVMQYVQPQSEIDKIISFLANHRNLDLNWYALQITFDTGGYYDLGSEMLEITKVRNGAVKLDFAYEPPENDYAGATTYARNNKVLTINSTNGLGALYLHELQLYELRICYGVEFKASSVQAVLITKCDIDGSYIDGCKFSATVPGSVSENACFYEAESVASLTLSACVFSGGSAWVRGNFLKLAGPRFVSPYPFYGIVSTFRCQTSVAPTGAQTAAYRSKNGGSVYLNGVNKI
jgi:hypothetical protein